MPNTPWRNINAKTLISVEYLMQRRLFLQGMNHASRPSHQNSPYIFCNDRRYKEDKGPI